MEEQEEGHKRTRSKKEEKEEEEEEEGKDQQHSRHHRRRHHHHKHKHRHHKDKEQEKEEEEDDDNDIDAVKQAKAFLETNKGLCGSTKLSEDDYFARNAEFRVWLHDRRNVMFEDLESSKAHKLFRKFVKRWNAGKLDRNTPFDPDRFYTGKIVHSAEDMATRTRHRWGFVAKMTENEQLELGSLRDDITRSTTQTAHEKRSRREPIVGRPNRPEEDPAEREGREAEERRAQKKEVKRHQREKELVLDELLPKATGRDAMIEKRRAQNEERKRREESPDMDEKDLMGGGDDFARRLHQQRRWKQARADKAATRVTALLERQKERDAQVMQLMEIRKQMGLSGATIPPRPPPPPDS